MQQPTAVHHTIVVTDTENFTDPARTNLDQLAIRHGLYKVIRRAFVRARIDWSTCTTEDRGDGVLILIPPDMPKVRLAIGMLAQLGTALVKHNGSCSDRTRIRLRVAVHAGEVHRDSHGVAGRAINHAFRLVNSPAGKAALESCAEPLAIIASDWFYDEVLSHYPAAEPHSYRRIPAMSGWIRLPGLVPAEVREFAGVSGVRDRSAGGCDAGGCRAGGLAEGRSSTSWRHNVPVLGWAGAGLFSAGLPCQGLCGHAVAQNKGMVNRR